MPRRKTITMDAVRKIALDYPGVTEGSSYGTVGFRVRGQFLARFWEDGETLVVKCGDEERDARLLANPEAFFLTDHYRGYPTVLIRLGQVSLADLRAVFECAWRLKASKRQIAEYEQRS
jgi:hypothetical protein